MTNEQWINELPAKIRDKVFANLRRSGHSQNYSLALTVSSIANAIHSTLVWRHTTEGTRYWKRVYEHYNARVQHERSVGMRQLRTPTITRLPVRS